MAFQHPIINDVLVERALQGSHNGEYGVHGISHWVRVEQNGLYLAERHQGDKEVISLFSLFHDSRRVNDYSDPGHGARGAELAEELYQTNQISISGDQLELLVFACKHHTDRNHTTDPTVGCCWDADRLDLPRVGIFPEVAFLNTDSAKDIAVSGNYEAIDAFEFDSGENSL